MIVFGTNGALAGSAANGTSVAPGYPTGITAGQMLVLLVAQKPTTAGGGTVTTPAGWTFVGSVLDKGGYGSTVGNAVGNSNVFWYTKVAVGSESGTVTITVAGSSVSVAGIYRLTTTSTGWDTPVLVSGDQTAEQVGSSISATTTSTLDMQGQDFLFGYIGTSIAISGAFNVLTASAPGLYLKTTKAANEWFSSLGNDVGGTPFYVAVANGSGTAAVTLDATLTAAGSVANMRGPLAILRLRENPVVSPTSIDKVAASELLLAENAATAPAQKMSASELQLAENPAYAAPTQKLSASELLLAETFTTKSIAQRINALGISVASVPAPFMQHINTFMVQVASEPAPATNVWVWDGTQRVAATVSVWDGTTKVPSAMSVT